MFLSMLHKTVPVIGRRYISGGSKIMIESLSRHKIKDVFNYYTSQDLTDGFINQGLDKLTSLYPNGDIHVNYNSLTGEHDATIGLQNAFGTDGIHVASGSGFASNEKSLLFSRGLDWLDFSGTASGQLDYGSSMMHTFNVASTDLDNGNYNGYVKITSNGGSATIPITLNVNSDVILGDINMDMSINVLDVVILTNFILEADTPDNSEFEAADINSDGILNVLDIVNLVNLILE